MRGWPNWGADNEAPVELTVVDKNRIDDGAAVTWVIAGDGINVFADGLPSGETNRLRCEMLELLSLGETSLCTLRPQGLVRDRITLNLPTVQLRTMGVVRGGWLQLAIAPEAVHIMPARTDLTRSGPAQAM